MRKFLLLVLSIIYFLQPAQAQKVGLVLSGGGAKGLTHIGIIRALEENNIPIDYIAGTSMGAIIGSLYAMGYSADDMEALIGSEDFSRWYTGKIEEDYMYYFKANRPTPDFFNIRLSFKDSLSSVASQILPTSVVNPIQMNLAFIELFAAATASSKGNFDNLFVPFRCIASDVYNKKELVLKNGDLGDAVRASMSFPFMFKSIEIDGTLAYDGGIYNNFPTDVMQEDFHPDIIIGSVVAKNPSKPDQNDIMSQLENMIMQKTDYTMPDSLGILLTFRYDNVTLMDFHKLEELQQIGYDRTMSVMDSIKRRIHRRVDKENVQLRRMIYRSGYPELRFKNIHIEGANAQQQSYIRSEFQRDDSGFFGYESVKRAYFRLLSDKTISEIMPHAAYRPDENAFDLYLKVKIEDQFSIRLGGNVSTTSSNQIYFGVTYQDLNYYSKEFSLDGQIGKIYNNAQFMAKMDFPTTIPTSYRFIASLSTFDYFKKDKIFSNRDKPAFTKKEERFAKLMVALPFLSSKRAEFSFGVAKLDDMYFQENTINFDEDKYDRSEYVIFGGSISINGSTLNRRQHATQGYSETLIAQIYKGKEKFRPGVESDKKNRYSNGQAWLQISYTREDYHRLARKFTLGSYVKGLYASRNFSENYTATMLQAGEFAPTAHSKLTYNEAFRANQYVAAGLKPILHLNNLFHLRGEFYGFMPIFPIERTSLNKSYYGKSFSQLEYMGEVSLICALPFGSIAAYVNHYSSPKREWNVGITLGWQLFNYRFFD